MTNDDKNVKPDKVKIPGVNLLVGRCMDFIEQHPRTGWYIAVCATLNVLLNLLDLFK